MSALNSKEVAQNFAILDDLLRLVVRAFYDPDNVVVIEVFIREHRAISDEEMSRIVHLNLKQTRKALNRLKVDKILLDVVKKEEKITADGEVIPGRKWQQQTFYYVDYKKFVDVVKYRLHQMQIVVAQEDESLLNQKYYCPRCHSKYSALDAAKLINPLKGVLECERCFFELRQEDNTSRVTELQNKKSTMLTQLKPITEQLKRTEKVVIPLISVQELTRHAIPSDNNNTDSKGKPSEKIVNSSNNYLIGAPQIIVNLDTNPPAAVAPHPIAPRPIQPKPIQAPSQQPVDATKPFMQKLTVTQETEAKPLPPWLMKQKEVEATPVESIVQAPQVQAAIMPSHEEPVLQTDDYYAQFIQAEQQPFSSATEMVSDTNGEQEDDPLISIGDRKIPLSQVTEDDTNEMTPEEYTAYYNLLEERS